MKSFSHKKRQLRVDILTIFISLFLSTILGIVYYSHWRSSEAVLKVSKVLIERTNESIVTNLNNFLRPLPFVKVSAYLLNREILAMSDTQAMSGFMHVILDSYPQLTNVYLADTKGNMFVENHVMDKPLSQQVIPFLDDKTLPQHTQYISEVITHATHTISLSFKNSQDQLIAAKNNVALSYDPRTRPWYTGAKSMLQAGEPWIGIYQLYGFNKNGITIAFPVFLHNRLVGVAAADLNIDLIQEELNKYSLTRHGSVFIVNNHGQLIASGKNTANTHSSMPTIAELNNPVLTKAYQINQATGQRAFNFTYQHEDYIANFKPYGFSKTEQWQIVIILPHNIFLNNIEQANKNILGFSAVMLFLGLLLIVISSHRISRPIIQLANETKEIILFKFDKPIKIKTHIHEVQVMIDALNATKSALSSFAKYVPKALVEQLLQSHMIAQLGGKKQTITILFTDIANFTEISERIDPEMLMLHFSEYLNALTQRIQANKGNIDKYIGDAIMAFWGAPLSDPNHVENACLGALACQQILRELNADWLAQGKPVFYTRFGLNTGSAIVGNLGSSDRLNYTAIGDAVNLAARLEGLNKVYGTEIIVSQSVFETCGEKFLFRPLDVVQVKGKSQHITIYELVAGRPDANYLAASEIQIHLAQLTWEAFIAYRKNDFVKAKALYMRIAEEFPNDQAAQIYLARF